MTDPGRRRPTLRERARPAEVLGLSAVLAAFLGLGVLFAARTPLLALEFAAAGFIVSVVVCATLLLAISKPEPPDDGPTGH